MTPWLLTRYCIIGSYVAIATIGISVQHYAKNGVPFSKLRNWSSLDPKLFTPSARHMPQTLSLTTLVCIELIKALGAVSVDSSILTLPPWRNGWLVLGVLVPMGLHVGLVHSPSLGLPALGEAFGLVELGREEWTRVLLWSLPMVVVDEGLKFVGRRLNKIEEENRRCEAAE